MPALGDDHAPDRMVDLQRLGGLTIVPLLLEVGMREVPRVGTYPARQTTRTEAPSFTANGVRVLREREQVLGGVPRGTSHPAPTM